MDTITIKKLEPSHLSQISEWFNTDAASTLFKVPQLSSFDFGYLGSRFQGWVALDGDNIVAVVTIDVDEQNDGYLDFAVKPSERRQGIGDYVVANILKDPFVNNLGKLSASTTSDNSAAQRTLINNNFLKTGYTPEGYLKFER
ncbi:GNAT family N-acetyltransferase [Candidatus Saccharibacteria bacterium]|nr:GNAT family N-acetyltransferase [Candidatus Saccharibacteria bacterium]MBI3337939.1 GNAT family N-acetyltransferase [Candidatus Saccharibacteria bacterium]